MASYTKVTGSKETTKTFQSGKKCKNKSKDLHLTIPKNGKDQLDGSRIGLDDNLTTVFFAGTDASSKPTRKSPASAPSELLALSTIASSFETLPPLKQKGTPKSTVTTASTQQQRHHLTKGFKSDNVMDVFQSKQKVSREGENPVMAKRLETIHTSAGSSCSTGPGHSQMTKKESTSSVRTILTKQNYRPISSSSTSPKSEHYFVDSDSEGEENLKRTHSPSRSSSSKSAGSGRESKGKSRFRRMLKGGLRRTHSAGCDQDVPAHALFLKHQTDKQSVATSQSVAVRSASTSEQGLVGSDSEQDDQDRKSKPQKKSFARDIKEKMAFLRRRHTDTALVNKVGDTKSQRVTPESVAKWSRSFDNLLYDKVGLEMLRDFLRSEFSDENLEFWIACEEYKTLKAAKIPEQAQKMYTDFVAVQAPREINLDSKTRVATRDKMSNPNKHTFEDAQKRIQALMEKDSYPRFLQSEAYLELCSDLKLHT